VEPDAIRNKQRVFVEEYLRCWNATEAALAAGYSARSARSIGQENLTKPDIANAIENRIAEKTMGADEVLIRLGEHARGDMGNFLAIGSMGFSVDLNAAKEMGLTHLIKKVKMRTTTTLSKDGVETETHDIEIDLYDAQAALVHIGRHYALFTDKTDVTSGGKPINIDALTDDQLLRLKAGKKIDDSLDAD
jgi:phage terminase small subunit